MPARIVGTGMGVPKNVVSNEALSPRLGVSPSWIEQRTGIRQRYLLSEGESLLGIAVTAAKDALHTAGIAPESLDAVLVGTVSSELSFPSFACQLQGALNAHHATAFDVSAACCGFVYSVAVADQFIRSREWRTALVLGVDALSTMVSWDDPATAAVFGDGAAAVVLVRDNGADGIMKTALGSDGRLGGLVQARSKGVEPRYDSTEARPRENTIFMHGPELFKIATKSMTHAAIEVLKRSGLCLSDVSVLVPHQANARIIAAVCERLGLPICKAFMNIDLYGNTSAASVPLALHDAVERKRITRGDIVMLDAFGGGLTWGACLCRW